MNKSKKALPAKTDIHAISPLPIDFIEDRLMQLNKRGMEVNIIDLTTDGRVFQFKHAKMRSVTTGTLRRWEGTHTRIDATTTLELPPAWIELVAHLIVIGILFIVFGGCTTLLGMGSFLSFVGSLVGATVFSMILPVSQYFDRYRKQALKHADTQMKLITWILTSNLPDGTQPLIEFDGTNESLEIMLRRQRNRK